jgi:hypothetical protein
VGLWQSPCGPVLHRCFESIRSTQLFQKIYRGRSRDQGNRPRLRVGSGLGPGTNEFLNMLLSLRETSGQAIGLSSLETGLDLERIAAESPDANHHFELWETFSDLLAPSPRRRERVWWRQRRDADRVALGFNQWNPFVERRPICRVTLPGPD